MNALLLSGVLGCFLAAEDRLLEQLDADFRALLAEDENSQLLREAARALDETDQSSHWTRYLAGLKIIRQTRSKAAIPLLLKYMIRHANLGGWQTAGYADTLTILTGKPIADPPSGASRSQAVREYVAKLVAEWWTPGKATITTDLGRMSKEELETVTGRLLEKAAKYGTEEGPGQNQDATAYRFYHLLYYRIMSSGSTDERTWSKDDLHPVLVSPLLGRAGYQEHPPDNPVLPGKAGRIPYAAIPMLATLRKNGDAPTLDQIAADPRQNSAARLLCVLALYAAGESLQTPVLLQVLEQEKSLELRLVAILALRDSREKRRAGERLMALLDDPNSEIRTAAICALRGPLPPPALPKLKQAIDDLDPPQAMTFIFDVIGEYKTREACEILAGFLSAALEDRDKAKHIYKALGGFNTASGKYFMEAGAHDDAFYRDKARAAITWWREEGRRTFPADGD